MARTVIGMSPWPVTNTMGRPAFRSTSVRCASSPFSPGMPTSRTRHAGPVRDPVDGVGTIGQQVQDDLLELYPVAVDCRQVLRQFQLHGDAPTAHFAPDQCGHLAEEVVHADRGTLERRLSEQAADPVD